jgi:type II secretory pathway predicted ATPase ExeA
MREGRRPAALLGPPGLGKTLLLHLAGKRLDDWLRSVYLPYAALPLDELCAWALSLIGFSQSSDTIGDLLQTASELRSRGSALLLLIDDASAMPLPTARKLGDLIASSSGALHLLAAAAEGPSASRMLAATGANVHLVRLLEPMNEEETREYVAARLARARIPASVAARFDAATLRRIHRLSAGIPRRANGAATSVLRGGVGEGWDDEEIAQAAVAELAPVPDAASAEEEALVQPEFELPPWAASPREEGRVERAPSARAVFATALLFGALSLAVSGVRSLLAPPPAITPPAAIAPPAATVESPAATAPPAETVETPERAMTEAAPSLPAAAAVADEPPEEPPPVPAPVPAPDPLPAPSPEPTESATAPDVGTVSTVSVDLNARPWALIQVDGVDLGPTPIAGIPLLAGKHRFRARMPDGRVVERVVEVTEQNRFIVFE